MNRGLAFTLVLLLLAGLSSLHVFLFLRPRAGKSGGAWVIAGIMAGTAWWSLLNALELLAPSLGQKLVLANFQYLAICALPVLQYRLGTRLLYRDEGREAFWSLGTLVWVVPIISSTLVWFDPQLGLMRRNFSLDNSLGFATLVKDFGPWFWVHAAYSYILIAIGTLRLIIALARGSQAGKAQAWILSAAALVPSLANLAFVAGLWPLPAMDPTPVAFTLSGLAYILGFSRFRFLAVLPFAQDAAIAVLREGVIILDRAERLVFMNEAAKRLFGLSQVEAGRTVAELIGRHPALAELSPGDGGYRAIGVEVEGVRRDVEIRSEPVLRRGSEVATVYSLHDISLRVQAEEGLRAANKDLELRIAERTSELSSANDRLTSELDRRRETERQLFFFSLHDPLTGLANRSLLLNRLGQAIERLRREPDPPYALIYIDFDNFKHVNDSYGHAAGDAFLRETSARLTKAVRAVDTVARLGGDEFVVLLDKVHDPEEALDVGDRIAGDLSVPIRFGGNSLVPSASLGILRATKDYAHPEDLLRDADLAMYHAKAGGKNRRVVFDESMRAAVLERTRLTNDLNRAILDADIELHYQPIVRLSDRSVVGCEALARWQHLELGRIGPDRFIPVAEEAGLIVPLGLYVLMEACRTAVLMKELTGSPAFFIAVNVSAIQLAQPDFAAILVATLGRHGLTTESIHLEITESALVERTETVLPLLHELKDRGFHFKLDDFGTGYSSLAYLHRFPISTIKIDRSFVSDLESAGDGPSEGAGEGILKGIVSLGHELGKGIVAEGIETEKQARILGSWGCDFGQGWLFGKAMPREAWLERLAAETKAAGPSSP